MAGISQGFRKLEIRASEAGPPGNSRLEVKANGDLVGERVSVLSLLIYAYDVPANSSERLLALPDWAARERFDIEAQGPAHPIPDGGDESQVAQAVKEEFRELLSDRFHLVMRRDERRMPVYALVLAKGGARFKPAPEEAKACVFDSDATGCHNFAIGFGHPLIAQAVSMDDLAHYIENWTDLPVVDRTGLSGLFTMNSDGWLPMRLPPPPPGFTGNGSEFSRLPTIFTTLGKLGLELRREESTSPVYTVERLERPQVTPY